ncbi:WAS/WASL-interacting protein family member 3-like [Selaginella moellendorffii]|uniref:WAS/WASL-interacting protein family member 3-like n=1 Tax=Selaginella moellendorffii TaxID=88036 RepID=UPI000D1CE4ED|nr:WAS/WASL-interacting protein family member 3-like [Selaginella moellendorffii]|eukprot:XP_024544560.1 WAS/WASL-interacting protein family member 3-like [Selaginella moellendorffii]
MAPKKDTPAQRDECVNYAMEALWGNFDQYLKDKVYFPRIISHAVARTMAGMVHMVSVGLVPRMESWDDPIVQGRVPEEWIVPQEPVLPPLDTWARCVLPVKQRPEEVSPPPAPPIQEEQPPLEQPPSPAKPAAIKAVESKPDKPRRATITVAPGQPLVPQGGSPKLYDRKGSPVRRFSEGTVLPPEMIQKISPPRPPEDTASIDSSSGGARSSMARGSVRKSEQRKSLVPPSQRSNKLAGDAAPKAGGSSRTTRRASIK